MIEPLGQHSFDCTTEQCAPTCSRPPNETAEQVIHRCLDFWRVDLYASGGVASLLAAKAIVGELKLAGYDITKSV